MDEKDKKIAELEKQLAEKDRVIEAKNQDIIGARRQYKKLSDMTEEEKNLLSEKELELQKRMEELDDRTVAFEQEQKDRAKKQAEEVQNNLIKKYAGDDKEITQKIKDNLSILKGAEEAMTEAEISTFVGRAWNMLGDERPDPVRSAVNNADGEYAGNKGTSFADTARGQEVAKALNLPIVKDDNSPKTAWGVLPE